MPCYFFSGDQYIRVTRGDLNPGSVDLGYPGSIANWGWGNFGAKGIDAALSSGPKDYFFSGDQYIRVTRGATGAGTMDPGYPAPISNWGWGDFGKNGIDAALSSGSKCYFFSGKEYIRVTRGDTGAGTVDPGYPAGISNWGWGDFGKNGIDAALNSGPVDYFFSGNKYIRVTRGDTGAGTIDEGYPAPIWNWGWGVFGSSGINAALFSGLDALPGGIVTPPPRMGSNSNYYIHANGNDLIGVVATINIEQNLVMKSATVADGFSFQLNTYAGKGGVSQWQQYVVSVQSKAIYGVINNWGQGDPLGPSLINIRSSQHHNLGNYTVPAGYQLKIALTNDASNNITGATFTAIDNNGKVVLAAPMQLGNILISPIVAMTMNIVGVFNKSHTVFSSGSGSIIYQALNQLTVDNGYPSFVEFDDFTSELASSTYGDLPSGPASALVQHFGITADGSLP